MDRVPAQIKRANARKASTPLRLVRIVLASLQPLWRECGYEPSTTTIERAHVRQAHEQMTDVLASLDNNSPIMPSPPKLRLRKAKVTAAAVDKAAAKACTAAATKATDTLVSRVKLLAISFNQCTNPGTRALLKLSRRCGMSLSEIEEWFDNRRMLEEWCVPLPSHAAFFRGRGQPPCAH